jgi:hypothetical protein
MTPRQIVDQLKRPYLVRAASDGYHVLVPPPARRQSPVPAALNARPLARLRIDAERAYYATGWAQRVQGAYPPRWVAI